MANTIQLTATLNFSSGADEDVTSSATWASSATGTATVVAGLVTAVAPGTTTITATHSGKSGTSAITVTDTPQGMAVAPDTAALEVD